MRKSILLSLAAWLALAAGGCSDPIAGPPPGRPLAFSLAVHGPAEAFDQADRIAVRVTTAGVVTLDTVIAFQSDGGDVAVRLSLPGDAADQTSTIFVEVRLGSEALFRGTGEAVATVLPSDRVEIVLEPVVAAILGPAEIPTITTLGATLRLAAAPVMATGDTVPAVPLSWTALDAHIVSVTPDGTARGVGEGTGRIVVRGGGAEATLNVTVRAVVARVTVAPDRATLAVGAQRTFIATARDAAGNALVRTAAWSSTNQAAATVNANGIVRGTGVGAATIQATIEGITGSAQVTVVAPVPASPTGFIAQTSLTTVRLSWIDNATDETSYEVRRGAAGSTQRALIATLGANATAFTDSPGPDLVLDYSVAACNAAGCSAPAVVTTRTVPNPPEGLDVDLSSTGAFTLHWIDRSATETRFEIEANEDFDFALPWFSYATVGPNVTNLETNLGSYEFLAFRVVACNDAGCSAPSNAVFVYYFNDPPGAARTVRASALAATVPRRR